MGCSSSSSKAPKQPAATILTAQAFEKVAPASGKGKGKGKGKEKGKGKGKGKGAKKINKESKFQIDLQCLFKDYEAEEDGILKRAFLIGRPSCRFHLRGQDYEYSFQKMEQKNLGTKKTRKIRVPYGMTQPKSPLLPSGPMIVIQVPPGGLTSLEVNDPNNAGRKILVALPPRAKAGSKLAVPVPAKGEDVKKVVERQRGMSTGAKVAAGAAAVGALAVGGVVLGEHLTGGALSSWAEASPELDAAGDWAAGAAEDVADWAAGAADWAGEAGGDAGDWAAGAVGDAGDWAAGAAEDVGDWASGAAGDASGWAGDAADWAGGDAADWAGDAIDDVGDWLGGAGEDIGGFVTDLF